MPTPMFNTHAVVKRLQQAGFTEQQAEVQADVLFEVVTENLASKDDLKQTEARLGHNLDAAADRLDRKIEETADRLDRKIDDTAARLDHKIDATAARLDHRIEQLRGDLRQTEERLQHEITETAARLDHRIEQLRADTKAESAHVKAELIRWMIGVGILQTSLIAALLLKLAP